MWWSKIILTIQSFIIIIVLYVWGIIGKLWLHAHVQKQGLDTVVCTFVTLAFHRAHGFYFRWRFEKDQYPTYIQTQDDSSMSRIRKQLPNCFSTALWSIALPFKGTEIQYTASVSQKILRDQKKNPRIYFLKKKKKRKIFVLFLTNSKNISNQSMKSKFYKKNIT